MKLTRSFYQSLDEWVDVSVTEPVNVFDHEDAPLWDEDSLSADADGELEVFFFTLDA